VKKILKIIGALVAGGINISIASLLPQAVEAGKAFN
jgi:hypothetical protein